MPDNFTIKIEGLKELEEAVKKFPLEVRRYTIMAGQESANKILLPTEGLQKYPPATAANFPPEPYYIRGRGTMRKGSLKATSERLGTQWRTKAVGGANWRTTNGGAMGVEIGNRASYARWVHGEEQAGAMAKIGWRRLVDVAKEKTAQIVKIYDKWIKYTLKKVGLM